MALFLFCKTDPHNNRYHIEGQILRESVRKFYTCSCFINNCSYSTCNKCCNCNSPVEELNWNDICDFMINGKNHEKISILINKSCFTPLTPEIARSLSFHKVKFFNKKIDSNAYIVADNGNGNYKIYVFTKYMKQINKNGIVTDFEEIELTTIKYDRNTTILTPNWNLKKNLWLINL